MEERKGVSLLRRSLRTAGAVLLGHRDRGDAWLVDYLGPAGGRHAAVVAKHDLTVLSAGICLDGCERDFDLTSLVRVVEEAPDWSLDEEY